MARYLFVVPPFYGHINPTLGIGRELLRRGHKVLWVGLQDIRKDFIPDGGDFIVPHELEEHRNEINQILSRQDNGTRILGDKLFEWSFEGNWIPFCRFMVDGLRRIIKEFRPDGIIGDENMKAGPICAYLEGIPYATSIAVPPGLYYPSVQTPSVENWLKGRMTELQREYGIQEENLIFNSPLLNFVYTSRKFISVSGIDFNDRYQFVGPIVERRVIDNSFDWSRIDNKTNKKIYVSIGTVLTEIKKAFFTKIAEAFKNEDYTIVAAAEPELLNEWPTNFIVQAYCPQFDLIPKVDLVICHGGFNTVNETLFRGKPLLVIPLAFDQFGISHMVADNGCGIRLRYRRLTSEDLRNSVEKLLRGKSFQNNLLAIEESMKAAGGAKRAADLVEKLLIKEKAAIWPGSR